MWILFGVFLGGLVIFHLLEPLAPVMTSYKAGVTRRGYVADIIHTIVNGPVLSHLTDIASVWLVLYVPMKFDFLPKWSWAAQFIVFFIVNDIARYWLHRWYHEIPWLWRIHRVHHSCVEMDCLSVFRIHVLEAVFKNGLIFLPFMLCGLSKSVIIAYTALDIIKGYWHHANLRTYIGPLNFFFNSAELHWWHHAAEGKGMFSNYGSVLSIWDWVFRTAYWPKGKWPEEIGVKNLDAFPEDYVGHCTSIIHDDVAAERVYGSRSEHVKIEAAPAPVESTPAAAGS